MPSLPRAMPNVRAVVIGCADMRVDPAYVLGIKLGEAVVIRNIGGRITPGLLEQLGLLGRIGEVAGEIPGGGAEFHLIILQHTDCGITRLTGDRDMLMHYFKYRQRNLAQKRLPIPERRLRSTLPCSGQFRHCQASGLSQASFMTWRPGLLRRRTARADSCPVNIAALRSDVFVLTTCFNWFFPSPYFPDGRCLS